ncbi:hypothetical protein AKJ16_DCAP06313 [Drosera capensis]
MFAGVVVAAVFPGVPCRGSWIIQQIGFDRQHRRRHSLQPQSPATPPRTKTAAYTLHHIHPTTLLPPHLAAAATSLNPNSSPKP